MRERVWKDCPVCGKKGSMKWKKNNYDTVKLSGYKPIRVGPFEAYICNKCGEGFNTIAANRLRDSQIAEAKALQDSERVVAADLIDANTLAEELSVSRQRVHKMMNEGKIPYVFVGKIKYPVRKNLKKIRNRMKRSKAKSGV